MAPSIWFRIRWQKSWRERFTGATWNGREKEATDRGKEAGWYRAFLATSTAGHRRSLLRQGHCLKVPSDTPRPLILLPSLLPPLLLSTVLLAARFLNLRFLAVKLACPMARVGFIIYHHQPFQNPVPAPCKTRARTKRSVCNSPQPTFQPCTSHLSKLQFPPSKRLL